MAEQLLEIYPTRERRDRLARLAEANCSYSRLQIAHLIFS
jgi:hypothetical protein